LPNLFTNKQTDTRTQAANRKDQPPLRLSSSPAVRLAVSRKSLYPQSHKTTAGKRQLFCGGVIPNPAAMMKK